MRKARRPLVPPLDPEALRVVMQRLDALAERNRNLIGESRASLQESAEERHGRGMSMAGASGRFRSGPKWAQVGRLRTLSVIFGFRVVMDDIEACYRALGVVHTTGLWCPGPVQGLHLDTKAERLSFDPTPP